jgi:hypothetical protein
MWAKWTKYTRKVIKQGGGSFKQGVEGRQANLHFR